MIKEEIYIPSKDGKTKLHTILWEPEGIKIKAVVQLVHGMCEYIDRYDEFTSYLADHGIAVIGHDHLGHGYSVRSKDDLGFFAEKNGDKIVIDDMYSITKEGKKRWGDIPFFILGHSMGSLFLRQYITEHSSDIDGAVIMGTAFLPAALGELAVVLSKILCAFCGLHFKSKLIFNVSNKVSDFPFRPNRTPSDWLSRNTENVDKFVSDKLCGFPFAAEAYRDFMIIVRNVSSKIGYLNIRLNLPLLITSGEVDAIGGKRAVTKLAAKYRKFGMMDVSEKTYPNDRHEILNETDHDAVFSDLLEWIISKI